MLKITVNYIIIKIVDTIIISVLLISLNKKINQIQRKIYDAALKA